MCVLNLQGPHQCSSGSNSSRKRRNAVRHARGQRRRFPFKSSIEKGSIFISHHYCESSSYFRLSTIPYHETSPPPKTKCFSSPGSIASGRVAGGKCCFERRSGFAASGTNLQAGTRRKCLDGVVRIGKERGEGMDGGSGRAVRWKKRSWDGREMRRGWKVVCLFEAFVSSTVAY